jgi:hypothetical protein
MFTSARSAGLSFWTSVLYTGAGSLGWELFAESEPPSANDMIMTTLSGLMLGEITYRLASELLDDSSSGSMRLWREVGAAAVSPMRGFTRATTGQAWSTGPPPERHAVRADLHVGAEVVRVTNGSSTDRNGPSLLLATDIRYGRLGQGRGTLQPFTSFEFYAGVSLLDSELAGARIDATGLLYGWGWPLSSRFGARDDGIFGIAMTYEFQGSNVTTYGGVGLGPASYASLQLGAGRRLRIGAGVDLVPMLSVAELEPAPGERGYTFGAVGATWGSFWLDLASAGSLDLRSRQYATMVLDGGSGGNFVSTARLTYELRVLGIFGLGAAPMLTYRRTLERHPADETLELSAQLFLQLRR